MNYYLRSLLRVLLVCSIFCGTSAAHDPPMAQQQDFDTGIEVVSPHALLALKEGTALTELAEVLEARPLHQFTYRDSEGTTWCLVEIWVGEDERGSSYRRLQRATRFWLLFRDGAFDGLVPWIGAQVRQTYTDDTRIRAILSAPRKTGAGVRERLDLLRWSLERRERATGLIPAIPLVEERLGQPIVQWDLIAQQYEHNARLLQHLDGLRVSIGMTRDEVRDVLGDPLNEERVDAHLSYAVYGVAEDAELFYVKAGVRYSSVVVLFENERVTRVLSREFIDTRWADDHEDKGTE
jgi:hypothetical protein